MTYTSRLYSEEGATQGDVAAMQMYGIAMKPLIDKLGQGIDPAQCKQGWYAYDASATGHLEEMKKWWDLLCITGPKYGYNILICQRQSCQVGFRHRPTVGNLPLFRGFCCSSRARSTTSRRAVRSSGEGWF